jgi:hypothetical protein
VCRTCVTSSRTVAAKWCALNALVELKVSIALVSSVREKSSGSVGSSAANGSSDIELSLAEPDAHYMKSVVDLLTVVQDADDDPGALDTPEASLGLSNR